MRSPSQIGMSLTIGLAALVVAGAGPGATLTTLHKFQGGGDGANPVAGMVMNRSGNLYGTTSGQGDAGDNGSVFLVPPTTAEGASTETVLCRFSGVPE